MDMAGSSGTTGEILRHARAPARLPGTRHRPFRPGPARDLPGDRPRVVRRSGIGEAHESVLERTEQDEVATGLVEAGHHLIRAYAQAQAAGAVTAVAPAEERARLRLVEPDEDPVPGRAGEAAADAAGHLTAGEVVATSAHSEAVVQHRPRAVEDHRRAVGLLEPSSEADGTEDVAGEGPDDETAFLRADDRPSVVAGMGDGAGRAPSWPRG